MNDQNIMHSSLELFSSRVEVAKTAADIQSVFHKAHAEFERLRIEAGKLPNNETACVAGCDYCCHYTVSLRAHEIIQVTEHIRTRFPKPEIAKIRRRAKNNRTIMKTLSHDQIEHTNIRCPLLSEDGLCSCYEVRPLNCRKNNSRSIERCRQFHQDPTADLMSDSAKEINQFTGIIGYALSEGFTQNGYDDALYYLNHGLYEGLKSSRPAARWYKKKTAFSRSAESKEFD